LEARGLDCWIASRNVGAGENFQEAIVHALREARVMLLVFTSNANNSDEIKKELVLAGRHHVTVVPARVEDVVPSDAFTYELATRQWIDLFKDWELEIEQLATQLEHILQTAKPQTTDTAATVLLPPRRRVKRWPQNQLLIIGLSLVAVLIAAGGVVAYLKPWAQTPQPVPTAVQSHKPVPVQTAQAQTAPVVQPSAPVRTERAAAPRTTPSRSPATRTAVMSQPMLPAPAATPPSEMSAASNPDETAWQVATNAGTLVAFTEYLRNFSVGTHVQEAQLRVVDLILSTPATGTNFDGSWQTTWSCPNVGLYLGYTTQFIGNIANGVYHGIRGTKGEPSSLVLDGRIEADGTAAFLGEAIVGSSLIAMGAARGTPVDFHALAQFRGASGNGKRIEGRPCSITFEKK
jgi:hypothetical protein